MTAYDPLTDDEMAELVENPMLVHLYDAHRLVAALVRGRRIEEAAREIGSDRDEDYCFSCHSTVPCAHDDLRAALEEVHEFAPGNGCMSRCRCGKTFSDPVHGEQPENIRRLLEAVRKEKP
jgi:hypothetical protein